MKTSAPSNLAGSMLEGGYDGALLKRLGKELSLVYGDTLGAALPPSLQSLVDRLTHGAAAGGRGPNTAECLAPRT